MIIYLFYRISFLTAFMWLLIQPKYSVKKTATIVCSITFSLWVINAIIYKASNVDFANLVYPITVTIPAFLCFLIVSKPNKYKVLFSFLTVCNFGMLTSYIGLLSQYISKSFFVRFFSEFVSVVLIFVIVLKLFRKPYFKILNLLDKGWGFLCTFPLLLSAIIYLLLYYPTEFTNQPDNIPVIFLVFAIMFVFYAVIYYNFENISELYQLNHNKEVILIQTEMQKKEYNAIMEKVTATNIYRHDMRHNINIIHTLLMNDNIVEAKRLLVKLTNNLSETSVVQYCENYMVNVILSTYIKKAEAENIKVKCQAVISENNKIDNMELGLIFTNAIENAIIACKKIKKYENREIIIVCKQRYNQLYIQITNPYVGEISFDGEYPISKEKDHGIGTRSIASIAEKYDGIFSFIAENGIFKTTVILDND